MPARLGLMPVKYGSRGAKALATVLSERLGRHVRRYRSAADAGSSVKLFKLREGTDKLTQFQRFRAAGVSCPPFTTDRAEALRWLAEPSAVVCRTILRGSEGRGIVVAETADQVVAAPLYTKYIKKKKEFRVHVLNGVVIDVQEKRKRRDFTDQRDSHIRNVANGYVFCRDGVVEPAGLRELAVAATASLGYILGAVDLVYNERGNTAYVLEVNSTPGMEGTTLQKYADAIINWYRSP